MSIVFCWLGASGSSFQINKWIPAGFHVCSTMMQYILPAGHTSSPLFSIPVHLVEWLAFTCGQRRFYQLTIKITPKKAPKQTKPRTLIRWKVKGQREIIARLDSSINFLPIFNLAFNLINFMTLILSTYVLQDIVSLESPWIYSITAELNEWIPCFWFQLTPYLILI